MLQIHGRAWQFIMKPFLLLFICVAMTQKCCSQGACPTARDSAQKTETKSKSPQMSDISDLGTGHLPLGLALFLLPSQERKPRRKIKMKKGPDS